MFELTYFPTRTEKTKLGTEFRFWHTESLLNQSANLVDQCLKDLREFKQLEMFEFNLGQEIERAEKELEIESNRLDAFERDIFINQNYYDGLIERQHLDGIATSHADNATTYIQNVEMNAAEKHLVNIRDVITLYERKITDVIQKYERLLTERKSGWYADDKIKNNDFLQFRKTLLQTKKAQLGNTKILDFTFQKQLCFDRLILNFKDCLNRSIIAEEGLEKIYSYSYLKTLDDLLNIDDNIQSKINTLYIWVYDAIKFVSAYSQLDQSITICLSLKSLIDPDKFNELRTEQNDFNTIFTIPQNIIPYDSHDNLRFKGIGASLIGNVGQTPWKIEFKLPENGLYFRDGNQYPINQKNIPKCILGRVENRNSIRNIEYCGMVSLNNASPIENIGSFWTINIIKPNTDNESFSNIDDIIIELNLTGKL